MTARVDKSEPQTAAPFIDAMVRLGALSLLLYWSVLLVRPFITIIIWSAVLTVAIYPIYDRVALAFGGRRKLAALVFTLASLLIVVGPSIWLGLSLVESVRTVYQETNLSTMSIPMPADSVKAWPVIGKPIYEFWELASTNASAAVEKIVSQLRPLGSNLLHIGAETSVGVLKFLVSIVVAGFFFPPAPFLLDGVNKFARRLNAAHGEAFVTQAGLTIRAISLGVIGVSALQALLAGLGLLVAGIPYTNLITFFVLILGIAQIGPSIVLIPIIVFSWTFLDPLSALLFTAYMVPVNLIDNILRPILIGRSLKTPMPVILIGVIGGTLAYGITGLFLGPIVLAVIWELLMAWINEKDL